MTKNVTRPAETAEDAIEALYAAGTRLFSRRRYADAASIYRAMLMCAPRDERAWLGVGACHELEGELEVALEIYGAGRVMARPSARCELGRARLFRAIGHAEEAELSLARAEAIADAAGDESLRSLVREERGAMSP